MSMSKQKHLQRHMLIHFKRLDQEQGKAPCASVSNGQRILVQTGLRNKETQPPCLISKNFQLLILDA